MRSINLQRVIFMLFGLASVVLLPLRHKLFFSPVLLLYTTAFAYTSNFTIFRQPESNCRIRHVRLIRPTTFPETRKKSEGENRKKEKKKRKSQFMKTWVRVIEHVFVATTNSTFEAQLFTCCPDDFSVNYVIVLQELSERLTSHTSVRDILGESKCTPANSSLSK